MSYLGQAYRVTIHFHRLLNIDVVFFFVVLVMLWYERSAWFKIFKAVCILIGLSGRIMIKTRCLSILFTTFLGINRRYLKDDSASDIMWVYQ